MEKKVLAFGGVCEISVIRRHLNGERWESWLSLFPFTVDLCGF